MRVRSATTLTVLTALSLSGPTLTAAPALAAPAASTAWADDVTAAGGFVGMSPTRVLDTRDPYTVPNGTSRPLAAQEYYTTPLVAFSSHMPPTTYPVVPADATAVVVNVTATDPTANGYLSLSAAPGAPGSLPATSSLDFAPGRTVSNLVTVAVTPGTDPTVTVFNSAGTTDVILDVVGYYRPAATDRHTALTPTRLADSRTDGTGPLGYGSVRTIKVAEPELGTADARAVVLNVTATDPTADSFLTVYPDGPAGRPYQGSDVNFAAGRTVPNQVVVPVGANGTVDIYNHVGSVDVIVDLVGYYGPSGTSLFRALKTPVRTSDTRVTGSPLAAYSTERVPAVASDGSTPDVTAVEANTTVTDVSAPGHLTVFPGGSTVPDTSTLNVDPGLTVANSATTGVAADGTYSIHNHGGPVDVITDLTGYFTTS
ncbi:hypothetical protein [Kitasatospora sp. NPDC017646]|uniref:hypothetical protein n=1 Tax=Kitasatospora sp. NPDC017646 TaxID=3364024 RepID=UPI00379D4285